MCRAVVRLTEGHHGLDLCVVKPDELDVLFDICERLVGVRDNGAIAPDGKPDAEEDREVEEEELVWVAVAVAVAVWQWQWQWQW